MNRCRFWRALQGILTGHVMIAERMAQSSLSLNTASVVALVRLAKERDRVHAKSYD